MRLRLCHAPLMGHSCALDALCVCVAALQGCATCPRVSLPPLVPPSLIWKSHSKEQGFAECPYASLPPLIPSSPNFEVSKSRPTKQSCATCPHVSLPPLIPPSLNSKSPKSHSKAGLCHLPLCLTASTPQCFGIYTAKSSDFDGARIVYGMPKITIVPPSLPACACLPYHVPGGEEPELKCIHSLQRRSMQIVTMGPISTSFTRCKRAYRTIVCRSLFSRRGGPQAKAQARQTQEGAGPCRTAGGQRGGGQ
eukprot:1160080-Pelagomonas_calceolata.AAC.10